VTSQEPRTPHSANHDILDTEVIVVSSPAPVFVDSTGRRRRLLRWLSYAFGGLCMIYGGLVSVSLAGGPVSSNVVLPLPDLRDDDAEQEATGPRPAPIPAPSASARPVELFVPPRRAAAADVTGVAEPRPPAAPARSSAPPRTPPPTSAKPVESTTVPTVPVSVTPAPSATSPATEPPIKLPVPVPPAPPRPTSSGGTGGGGGISDEDADETLAGPATQTENEPADEPVPRAEETAEPDTSATAEQTA